MVKNASVCVKQMTEVYLKIRTSGKETVVSICDKDILGKKFKEGRLKIHVTESFYKGDLVPVEEAVKSLETATIANLVGENTISHAIKEGYVNKDSVIYIQGVPHVQIVKILF